jgi:hypothetical protein
LPGKSSQLDSGLLEADAAALEASAPVVCPRPGSCHWRACSAWPALANAAEREAAALASRRAPQANTFVCKGCGRTCCYCFGHDTGGPRGCCPLCEDCCDSDHAADHLVSEVAFAARLFLAPLEREGA